MNSIVSKLKTIYIVGFASVNVLQFIFNKSDAKYFPFST
jgi:hypothetical protein